MKISIEKKTINKIAKDKAGGNPFLQVFNSFFVEYNAIEAREATYQILEALLGLGRKDACDIINSSTGDILLQKSNNNIITW